jgi:hypothetical protein
VGSVPGLDEAELRGLLMAQPSALGDPKLAAAAERAFGKLMAALPGSMRDQATSIRARLHIEAHLMKSWRLLAGDRVLTEGPRYTMIADGALAHLAHHRGQLTVYLRLLEGKVPAIYGPSADEFR